MENKGFDLLDVLLGILSLVPLFGFIFFFVWKNSNPKRAKLCGIIGLVAFLVGIIGSVMKFNFNWF